jgi:hypothetical protein
MEKMKLIARVVFLSLSSLYVAACAPLAGHGVLKPGETAVAEDESIVVIGVRQPYYEVNFKTIDYNGPKNTPSNRWLIGAPSDGYLVGRVAAGITMEGTSVRRTLNSEKGLFGKVYYPCGGGDKAVFDIPRGKVLYIGDFDFSRSESQEVLPNSVLKLFFEYDNNIAAARAYLKKSYPGLAERLESADVQITKARNPCPQTTTQMLILIPSKK